MPNMRADVSTNILLVFVIEVSKVGAVSCSKAARGNKRQ